MKIFQLFRETDETKLLAIISTSPENFERRQAIRLTWGNDLNLVHRKSSGLRGQVIFQVGLHSQDKRLNSLVRNESLQFGDVLIQDFVEHYNNLTIKTVMLLKFVKHLDFQPDFVFKVRHSVKKIEIKFCLKNIS